MANARKQSMEIMRCMAVLQQRKIIAPATAKGIITRFQKNGNLTEVINSLYAVDAGEDADVLFAVCDKIEAIQ